jgi:hypothetical protein
VRTPTTVATCASLTMATSSAATPTRHPVSWPFSPRPTSRTPTAAERAWHGGAEWRQAGGCTGGEGAQRGMAERQHGGCSMTEQTRMSSYHYVLCTRKGRRCTWTMEIGARMTLLGVAESFLSVLGSLFVVWCQSFRGGGSNLVATSRSILALPLQKFHVSRIKLLS